MVSSRKDRWSISIHWRFRICVDIRRKIRKLVWSVWTRGYLWELWYDPWIWPLNKQAEWLFQRNSSLCRRSLPWISNLCLASFLRFWKVPLNHGIDHGHHHRLWPDIWPLVHLIRSIKFLLPVNVTFFENLAAISLSSKVYLLTFSQSVFTWFSGNCLHSFKCSIIWSSSL